jgi:hypothetical protein
MINAAAASKTSGRAISIYDDTGNIPLWIGAVQMAFPIGIAHDITFTALPDFSGRCMIKGVFTHEPDYMIEADGSFVFDFVRGYTSRVNLNLKFMRLVGMGYEASRAALAFPI